MKVKVVYASYQLQLDLQHLPSCYVVVHDRE